MSILSGLAVFFIIWWTVLFAMLPIGLRTQEENGDVTLGTTASAPMGPHVRWAMLRTTFVSLVIFGLLWFVTGYLGLGIDDIPQIVPSFD